MTGFFAAAGRLGASTLVTAADALAGIAAGTTTSEGEESAGAWGVAYCHGSRLEWLRSTRAPRADPECYSLLGELRTDMAMFCAQSGPERLSQRGVQPFVRREPTQAWAFCNLGSVAHPERLDSGPRVAEGADPGELLFLHLINRLDSGNPAGSAEATLAALTDETDLRFVLMCPEWLLAGIQNAPDQPPLWQGRGSLLFLLASQPVPDLPGVESWGPVAESQVLTITRERRELL